jgi:AcrR family transcriptional regulator
MAPTRRIGSGDSKTRSRLLDAAEQLMLDEGYAAVTSRRVGRQAGISSQLVHYYFRTMDDLFLEMFRRRADENLARLERALERDRSLRSFWDQGNDGRGAAFTIEFVALANHRKAIRSEIAAYAQRFRTIQLTALTSVIDEYDLPDGIGPHAVLLAMTGLRQVMALERALGVTAGHEETTAAIEGWLERLEVGAKRSAPAPVRP